MPQQLCYECHSMDIYEWKHLQVPCLLVLFCGSILSLLPVQMTRLILQLTTQCNIQAQLRDFLLLVINAPLLKELGI